jgi:hypothetical protein
MILINVYFVLCPEKTWSISIALQEIKYKYVLQQQNWKKLRLLLTKYVLNFFFFFAQRYKSGIKA